MRKDAPHILCFAKANNSIGLAAVQANNGVLDTILLLLYNLYKFFRKRMPYLMKKIRKTGR